MDHARNLLTMGMTTHARQGRGVAAVLAVFALAFPATAAAAAPTVTTGGATNVSQTSVVLNGTVDPNGTATAYFFQIGTTTLYGGQTAEAFAGDGASARKINAPFGSLAPFTTYHYRLIGRYGSKLVKGKDRTFKTRRQPLGLSLSATPNPVRFNGSTTLNGNLAGTGNSGRQVVLQSNPFPYTQGFLTTGNPQVVDMAGNFAFPILSLALNTQFRVQLPDRPEVTSPIVPVGVKVRVSTNAPRRVRRGRRAHFSGTVTPSSNGAEVAIQRRSGSNWRTIARTFAARRDDGSSRYRRGVKLRRTGTFRVLVSTVSGAHVSNVGRSTKVRVLRRR